MFSIQSSVAPSSGRSHASVPAARPRIRATRSLIFTGVFFALCSVALPASANWWSPMPTPTIGSAIVNVRDAGALGNGQHDDTAAFQAAINSLPATGGTITVPAGTYMINALTSINMRSNTRLLMDPLAQLDAIPNSSTRSYVIKAWRVNNVEITGGSIVGERVKHIGTTGEWGMGIDILASTHVFVHDLNVSYCWGDGLYIGAIGAPGSATSSTDITVNRVVSTSNRRQGLSFGPVQRVYVVNSTFSDTNGTAPQAGIDIEPSIQGTAKDIRIEASAMTGNLGNGLELHNNVTGLVVTSSTLKGNKGYGVLSVAESNIALTTNLITENWLSGIGMASTTHDVSIDSNTVTYNNTSWFVAHNLSIYTLTYSPRDMTIYPTTWNIALTNNTLTPRK
jgi:hypothetical protein